MFCDMFCKTTINFENLNQFKRNLSTGLKIIHLLQYDRFWANCVGSLFPKNASAYMMVANEGVKNITVSFY